MMTSVTGIELGPTSCVVVSARDGAAGAEVRAVHVIGPDEWRGDEASLVAALEQARRTRRLPRTARVVSWGLVVPASPEDAVSERLLRPIVAAGFRVEAVLTPTEALAQLAARRNRGGEGPIAWLSINTHGAAIAIVEGARLLFSRTISWKYNPSLQTLREQLLQRYSLVSHIGPELQRGMSLVRANHGRKVETVVTCGDLPDLRSLTMPLIEELDLEVETLDSTEGLKPRGTVPQERFAERAPAIRLACAAALMRMTATRPVSVPLAIAAGLMLMLGAFGVYLMGIAPRSAPVDARVTIEEPATVVPAVPAPDVPSPAPSTGSGAPSAAVGGSEPRQTTPPQPSQAPPAARRVRNDTPAALPDVPPLTSILIDRTRRLAMFGGLIVTVGDTVGPRTVVRINRDSVVLREPSGAEITVLLRQVAVNRLKLGPFAEHGHSPRTRTQAGR